MRRFELHRDNDPTEISGVGIIAEGVIWSDGTVSLRWLSKRPTTTTFNCIADVIAIHGHEGSTRVEFVDREPAFNLTGRPVPSNGRPKHFDH